MAASNLGKAKEGKEGKTVRIGGFSAFWGDTPTAALQLMREGGQLDYLIGDYLAELTLCILARSKKVVSKKGGGAGQGGYVNDFLTQVFVPLMKEMKGKGTKVITNAGGMNPLALKVALEEAAVKAGVTGLVIAAVVGDDLTEQAAQFRQDGKFTEFGVERGLEPLWNSKASLMSANAYLGAGPIAQALKDGAHVVVTGRCVDSALVLGPLMHEFGWRADDWHLMSAGSLAGHVIECGAQATGGNFTDWRDSLLSSYPTKTGRNQAEGGDWSNVGFPVAEVAFDGSFVLTKPEGTGGLVSRGSVGEQIIYEIDDPTAYRLPDVTCDWTGVTVDELPMSAQQKALGMLRSDRVMVRGAQGRAPSGLYKVGATSLTGLKATGTLLISGFQARQKAEAVAAAVLKKVAGLLQKAKLSPFSATRVEYIGAEDTYGPLARPQALRSREILLRISVAHTDKKAIHLFSLELAPVATGMAPGVFGDGSGRPAAKPCIQYYSCMVSKEVVDALVTVSVGLKSYPYVPPALAFSSSSMSPSRTLLSTTGQPGACSSSNGAQTGSCPAAGPFVQVPLLALCWARSGDKGDISNIGLIAREPKYYSFLCTHVTAHRVQQQLGHFIKGEVSAYAMSGLQAVNFVATRALGGGGISSLHMDGQVHFALDICVLLNDICVLLCVLLF